MVTSHVGIDVRVLLKNWTRIHFSENGISVAMTVHTADAVFPHGNLAPTVH